MLSNLLLEDTSTSEASKTKPGKGPPPGGPPPGPPPGGGAQQFASNTLSGLLSTQEEETSAAGDLGSKLIEDTDTDGDGLLSLEELQASLGTQETDTLSSALGKLDTDGDGKLSAEELNAGLEAKRPQGGDRPTPPSSADLASRLISDIDGDEDGALNLGEVQSALGEAGESDGLAEAFGRLDGDSDGKLSATELSAALDAFMAARRSGSETGTTVTA